MSLSDYTLLQSCWVVPQASCSGPKLEWDKGMSSVTIIFIEMITVKDLKHHERNVSTEGRIIVIIWFADKIARIAKQKQESTDYLDKSTITYKIEIGPEKINVTTNNPSKLDIRVNGTMFETLKSFKYLGSIIYEPGHSISYKIEFAPGKLRSACTNAQACRVFAVRRRCRCLAAHREPREDSDQTHECEADQSLRWAHM